MSCATLHKSSQRLEPLVGQAWRLPGYTIAEESAFEPIAHGTAQLLANKRLQTSAKYGGLRLLHVSLGIGLAANRDMD